MNSHHIVGTRLQAVALFNYLILQTAGGNLDTLGILVLLEEFPTQALVLLCALFLQIGEKIGDNLLGLVKGHLLLSTFIDGSQSIGKIVDIQFLDARADEVSTHAQA